MTSLSERRAIIFSHSHVDVNYDVVQNDYFCELIFSQNFLDHQFDHAETRGDVEFHVCLHLRPGGCSSGPLPLRLEVGISKISFLFLFS